MNTTKRHKSQNRLSTKQKKKAFLEAYARTWNISEACRIAGIERKTYYRWLEKDEKFKQKIHDMQEAVLDRAEQILYEEMLKKKNVRYILWFLERKGKNRGYAPKSEIEHSGEVNNIIKVEVVDTKEDG